jgi:hypothetical protein
MDMLEDFVTDLKTKLAERRRLDNDLVIANGGAVERGRVQAYERCASDIDELLLQYQTPESVPEHLQEETLRPNRRLYNVGRHA